MPHDSSGNIYSQNGQGVSLLNDVNPVLGISTTSVAYACMNQHGKINKWAKYKPELIDNVPFPISLEARKNNNFGLSAGKVYNSKTELVNAVKGNTFVAGWSYTPPGANNYKRLADFDGYYHHALSPFGDLISQTFVLSADSTRHLVIPASAPPEDGKGVSVSEMINANYDYKNWYFGILLYNTSRNFMATTTHTMNSPSADWQVDFGWINTAYAGTYKGIPFLSSKPFTVNGSEPSGVRITGIGNTGVTITLKSAAQTYQMFGSVMYADSTGYNLTYFISIDNPTSTARTFNGVVIEIAASSSGTGATTLISFGSVTVAAGTTWTKSGTKSVSNSNYYRYFRPYYTGYGVLTWIMMEERAPGEEG